MKKSTIITCLVLATLIITNPSLSRFKEFVPSQFELLGRSTSRIVSSRTNNYFFFSEFQAKLLWHDNVIHGNVIYTNEYIGICGNFYLIKSGRKRI